MFVNQIYALKTKTFIPVNLMTAFFDPCFWSEKQARSAECKCRADTLWNTFSRTCPFIKNFAMAPSGHSLRRFFVSTTAWKVPKYGVFSGPSFPPFGLNTERYSRRDTLGKYLSVFNPNTGKNRPEKTPVFGHFSRSELP